ncbi:MAG: hypothetical protein AB8B89_08510 [Gammaproteobacteria bacterium]
MNTVTANTLVLIGWGMTVALVYSLLSGPFDGRMCESTCFNMLYWGALVLAVLGTLLSLMQVFKPESGIFSKISLLLGLFLCAKLIGVMVIGTMAG